MREVDDRGDGRTVGELREPIGGDVIVGQIRQQSDRADRGGGERARVQRASHLTERKREFHHAHPGAAQRLGGQHPRESEGGEPRPDVVDGGLDVVVIADVPKRCALGEESPDRHSQALVIVGELEVHGSSLVGTLRPIADLT